MNRTTVVRSFLKVVGVAALLVAAWSAEARASDDYCLQQAAACAQTCGTTVDWGTIWSYYDPCYYYSEPFNICFGRTEYVEGAIFSSGMHQFECDEFEASYWCQCAY